MTNAHRQARIVYILSFLTPFTLLISGIIAIVYAGYRLDKGEDGEVVDSHYYGLIRSFFLYLTFFVVLIITVATTNGILVGVNDYWMANTTLNNIAFVIPYVGMVFAVVAIIVWLIRMVQGMGRLKQNLPQKPIDSPVAQFR